MLRSKGGKRSTPPHAGPRTTIAPEDPLSLPETRPNQAGLKDLKSRQEAHRAAVGSGSLKRICLGPRRRLTAHPGTTRSNRTRDCRQSRARGQLPKDLQQNRPEAEPVERRYCPASRSEHGVGAGRENIHSFNLPSSSRRRRRGTSPLPSQSLTRYLPERSSQ